MSLYGFRVSKSEVEVSRHMFERNGHFRFKTLGIFGTLSGGDELALWIDPNDVIETA